MPLNNLLGLFEGGKIGKGNQHIIGLPGTFHVEPHIEPVNGIVEFEMTGFAGVVRVFIVSKGGGIPVIGKPVGNGRSPHGIGRLLHEGSQHLIDSFVPKIDYLVGTVKHRAEYADARLREVDHALEVIGGG